MIVNVLTVLSNTYQTVAIIRLRGEYLAVKLNKRAFEHAKQLVEKGSCVSDDKDKWSEHQPSADEENKYIEKNGLKEYGKWYLGIDTDENKDNKGRYKFPYGDFKRVTSLRSTFGRKQSRTIQTF